ncbi:MAG TPA: phage tail protein, partial [Devosia sp.]|nr:phage tail protein [Devosia sp.]
MSMIFGGSSSRVNKPQGPETALRINSSVYGQVRIIGWGQRRISWNLIWYGDFLATAHQQGGGKGGILGGGGGKGGKGGGVSYTYSAAVAGGLCEGPVHLIGTCWDSSGSQFQLSSQNLTAFNGGYSQAAWSYLTSKHPSEADAYRGLAYCAAGPMQLGSSPALPNISFEVTFGIHDAVPGVIDAHPADILVDFLTNPNYGLGFPANRIGDLTAWRNYCTAAGLFLSPALTTAQEASQFVQELMEITNSEIVWSNGVLNVVPYGDQAISGNGATYTPPQAALYSLWNDDLMPNQGVGSASTSSSENADPIVGTRKKPNDYKNIIKVQFNERISNYNQQVVDAKDDGDIAMTGERPADLKTYDHICIRAVAEKVAQILLGRESYRNEFVITVGPEYLLLDPMDLIEAVNEALEMDNQWIRIKESTRNADKSFVFHVEEYLYGTGSAPVYGSEAGQGYTANTSVDPGDVSDPILLNPPSLLTGGALELWIAASGIGSDWGGCEVHISLDGSSYSKVGEIIGGARYGVLTTNLASGSDPDTVNSVNVDLGMSKGELNGGSQDDVDGFGTLAMIDGEVIAYRDATLVSTYERTLSYLRRGAFGTTIAGHLAGASFVRLDDSIYRFSYTSAQKGKTIYVKLPSFNIYGGGLQDLSTVTAYSVELDSDGKFYYPQPTAPGTVLLDQTTPGPFDFPTPDPASVKFLTIEMWAGGGPGGGASTDSKGSTLGYGGGSGGYIKHKIATPASGTVLSGVVGNGGVFGGVGG